MGGRGRRGWLLAYAAAQLVYWTGYGLYYTYSRMLVEESLGQAYSFIALLMAAETAPMLLSVLLGFLADRLGRARMMLLGLGEAAAMAAMGPAGLRRLPLLAAVAASFHAVSYTAYTGALLAGASGSGLTYSLVAMGGSVGWGLGGLAAGLAHGLGPRVEFSLAGILVGAGYVVAAASTPGSLEAPTSPGLGDVARGLAGLRFLAVSLVLSSAGLSLFAGAAALKLRAEIRSPVLYGLVFATITALVGAAVRPLAGWASDRLGHVRLLLASTLAYIPLAYGMLVAHGLLLAALWVLPVYPFRDVAMMLSASTMLPESLQATAAGVVSFSNSLSGLVLAALSPALGRGDLVRVFLFSALLLGSGAAALAPYMSKAK